MKNARTFKLAALATACAFTAAAHAGRPLGVDDASVNDAGAGHVETWVASDASRATVFNIAPAYAPIENLEISGLLSRDTTNSISAQSLQAKWRITPSVEDGCNVAAVFGVARVEGIGSSPYLTGNLTCNKVGPASIHVNLGLIKPKASEALGTWGIAAEFPMDSWTPHVEVFGVQNSKPTVQVGARTQLNKTVQLDGTVGRSDGQSLFSVGLKFQF
jgi:hypothetical protein